MSIIVTGNLLPAIVLRGPPAGVPDGPPPQAASFLLLEDGGLLLLESSTGGNDHYLELEQ